MVNANTTGRRGQGKILLRPCQRQAFTAAWDTMGDKDYVRVLQLPPGGGKTHVAVELVERFLGSYHGHVLWVAPRWELLDQAFGTLPLALRHQASRIGGEHQCQSSLPARSCARIHFTTLSTWTQRLHGNKLPRELDDSSLLVVIDESHWAERAKLGKLLRDEYLGRADMIGLSATPHARQDGRDRVVFRASYADLCPRDPAQPRYLARPRILSMETGIEWDPIVRNGMLTQQSLAELQDRDERNRMIVGACHKGLQARRFTRCLVFACSIAHAEELRRLFSDSGVEARCVHSDQPRETNHTAVEDFRHGRIPVIVTVTMLAVGIDIPAADAVVLGRPSESLTLLTQMIGRGSRLAPGKDSFWVIEIADKIRSKAEKIFHAVDYFGEAADHERRPVRQRRPPKKHREPRGEPRFASLALPGLPPLPYVQGQTFGVELEFGLRGRQLNVFSKSWQKIAQAVVECLQEHASLPVDPDLYGYHDCDEYCQWRVTADASCGLEVISPILVNSEGFEELARVCRGLSEMVKRRTALSIDHRCGLHLTLATRLNTAARQRAFLARTTRLEPGLYPMVAPSRLFSFDGRTYNRRGRNDYCQPLRELIGDVSRRGLDTCLRQSDRYHSVNFTKVRGDVNLMEIRMHQGTVDYRKIVPWICLWMSIFNRDRYRWRAKAERGRVLPGANCWVTPSTADNEDLLRLLFQEGIYLDAGFVELLRSRRAELRRFWETVVPTRVKGWQRAGWYDGLDLLTSLNASSRSESDETTRWAA